MSTQVKTCVKLPLHDGYLDTIFFFLIKIRQNRITKYQKFRVDYKVQRVPLSV